MLLSLLRLMDVCCRATEREAEVENPCQVENNLFCLSRE